MHLLAEGQNSAAKKLDRFAKNTQYQKVKIPDGESLFRYCFAIAFSHFLRQVG
ncbi:MAG: hypothetical protein NXH82_13245 [Rhodobacteraceae bacterium]|nr:hypothetical protein [Paracoccaceae bacterium]